jgi:predicted nucleic acid-binding protein
LIVIDCSYTLALVMPNETRPTSMGTVMASTLAAPMVWPLEVANALRSSVRRGRLTEHEAIDLCGDVVEFEIDVLSHPDTLPRRHFEMAQRHQLTPYDASYLDLALQRRCALATCDSALAAAARRAGVEVYD